MLETALEKDRARRYATALDFAEDLRRVREYEPDHRLAAAAVLVHRGARPRSFLEAMVNSRYREQYEDAVSCFLRAQEIAGLDIVTDGDAHYDEEVGGMSWQSYPLTHMAGFADGRRSPRSTRSARSPIRAATSCTTSSRRACFRASPAGRARQSAIHRDVEGGAAHDPAAGQVRHHPARAARRLGRGRPLQGPDRAHLGVQRRAQRGAQRARRCRLPGDPDGGAADPHGAGARQGVRQARHRRSGQDLQQHREGPARQDRGVVPHLLGQSVAAAHLRRRAELSADARGAQRRSTPTPSPSRPARRAPATSRRSARSSRTRRS